MLSEWQRGPQPYEAIVDAVCDAFRCTPDRAERQNWPLVREILDYRTARAAVDAFQDRKNGMAIFQANPELMEMLRDMVRAQTGANEAGIDAALAAMTPTSGEEEEE